MGFGSERTLLYNVAPWNRLGFGVPNFGDCPGTLNNAIARLVDEVGKTQLFIMSSTDAMRWKWPTINTVRRMAKLIMRVQSILSGRAMGPGDTQLEPVHATPAQAVFQIHPTPYFLSDVCRNPWMREYNEYVMVALSNMMQHSDNAQPLNITTEFATTVWQWFRQIKILMGTELLGLDKATVAADAFVFTEPMFLAYDPSQKIISMEAADTPGPTFNLPTEADLRPFFVGIPADQILPFLVQAPVAGGVGVTGVTNASGFTPATAGGGAVSALNVPAATAEVTTAATASTSAPVAVGGAIGSPTV